MDNNWKKGPHTARNKVEKTDDATLEIPAGDERKTVILDEDLEGLEFDDRVWLYWRKNKVFIMSTIVLAFAIVFGVNAWKVLKAQREQAMSNAYGEAVSVEQLEAFALEYAGTQLAGVALLGVADKNYLRGNFAKAVGFYKKASAELKGNVLYGRALLGEAMSGNKGAGDDALLKSVYENPSIANSYRAGAGFNMALNCAAKKNVVGAKKILEAIASNPENGAWVQQANAKLSEL